MSNLTLEELKEQNPALYAQSMQEGVAEGVQQERARCISHLPKHVTDPMAKYAVKCVKEGAPMGDLQKAMYQSMQFNAMRKERKQAADTEYVVSGIERKFGVDNEHHKY